MLTSKDLRPIHITLNSSGLERVDKFEYLDACINKDWNPYSENGCRIELAHTGFMKTKAVLSAQTWILI